jgi:hypothetical protein
VLSEGLAVALEAVPSLEGRLAGPGVGGLAAAGELGRTLAPSRIPAVSADQLSYLA